ncbi:Protein of unknown function [Gryllus bimaculatus]|nr:Protein of unknown function [Gryllus bimaculatus]
MNEKGLARPPLTCDLTRGARPFLLQTTCLSELPDVAPPLGLVRGQNGSLRCNGRPTQIQPDSGSSCSSKGDSSAEGAKVIQIT